MQVLSPRIDFAGFVSRIRSASERLLMLDYDGTLAPFHVRPDEAAPYPEVAAVLHEIVQAGGTRVVVVSGRPAAELPPLLGLDACPEIWGSHGWERLTPGGRRILTEPAPEVRRALEDAARAIGEAVPHEARLERKLASLALHWRGLDAGTAGVVREAALKCWELYAEHKTMELLPFDGGLELRAVGCNKQYAVKAVLAETEHSAAIAYLGDDITDEDAFRAVKQRGLGVLVRPEFRQTDADVWLRPPQELAEFLRHWRVEKNPA